MGHVYTNSQGKTYYLNKKESPVRGDRIFTHYFYSPDERPETACDLPGNMEPVENPRNGFPVLRKKK